MALEVEAGRSKPVEAMPLVHKLVYSPRRPVLVHLKIIVVGRKNAVGVKHTATIVSIECTRGVPAHHPTAMTIILMTRVKGKTLLFEILSSTPASDMMDPRHRDAIPSPMIIRNTPGIVHFLRPPESDPEAEAHCRSPLLALKDPSVNANATATAAGVWKEKNDLNGIMQRGMGLRDPIAYSLLLVDVPYPHATMPLTVDTPNEVITQTKLVPVAEAGRHLGTLILMTALRNPLAHVSTLKFEISVILHGLPPAVPRSHILTPLLAQSDGRRLEAPQRLAHILAGRLLLSPRESIILFARPRIAALVDLERRPNTVMSPDFRQAGHWLLELTVLK